MKKYIVTNGKGLRFQDQNKDFQLKNNQEFEAKPTEYMAYLVKNKFIKEVELEVEPKAEPAKPKAEPAKPEAEPAKPEAKPAKPEAKPAKAEAKEAESPEAAEPKTEVKKSTKK